jgi:hypothetical protein
MYSWKPSSIDRDFYDLWVWWMRISVDHGVHYLSTLALDQIFYIFNYNYSCNQHYLSCFIIYIVIPHSLFHKHLILKTAMPSLIWSSRQCFWDRSLVPTERDLQETLFFEKSRFSQYGFIWSCLGLIVSRKEDKGIYFKQIVDNFGDGFQKLFIILFYMCLNSLHFFQFNFDFAPINKFFKYMSTKLHRFII